MAAPSGYSGRPWFTGRHKQIAFGFRGESSWSHSGPNGPESVHTYRPRFQYTRCPRLEGAHTYQMSPVRRCTHTNIICPRLGGVHTYQMSPVSCTHTYIRCPRLGVIHTHIYQMSPVKRCTYTMSPVRRNTHTHIICPRLGSVHTHIRCPRLGGVHIYQSLVR